VRSCLIPARQWWPFLLELFFIVFRRSGLRGKIALTAIVFAITPYFLFKLLRVDSLMSPSDGMGVRIIYWSTFFSHFKTLSMLGSGFMSAQPFLTRYSPIYLGEPHLHDLFLNAYLDFGVPGLSFYVLFLTFFYRYCKSRFPVSFRWYWTAAFLPLISIMLTLSTGYESDTVIYLLVVLIIGQDAARTSQMRIRADVRPLLPKEKNSCNRLHEPSALTL